MFETTTKYIYSIFRHLTIVVVLSWAFIFYQNKVQDIFYTVSGATITPVFSKAASNVNSGNSLEKISSKIFKKKPTLEAILALHHVSFKLPVTVLKIISSGNYIISKKQSNTLYAARAPGESLVSRIFPITIQPNAP